MPRALPQLRAKVSFFSVRAFSDWLSPCNDSSSITWQAVGAHCWNPGIFHHNWPWIHPNLTWRVLSSQLLSQQKRAGKCSQFHRNRRVQTSPFQGNSFNSHFCSCNLRLQTRPFPFLWALGMGGNGQDRQMEPWGRNELELLVWAQNYENWGAEPLWECFYPALCSSRTGLGETQLCCSQEFHVMRCKCHKPNQNIAMILIRKRNVGPAKRWEPLQNKSWSAGEITQANNKGLHYTETLFEILISHNWGASFTTGYCPRLSQRFLKLSVVPWRKICSMICNMHSPDVCTRLVSSVGKFKSFFGVRQRIGICTENIRHRTERCTKNIRHRTGRCTKNIDLCFPLNTE